MNITPYTVISMGRGPGWLSEFSIRHELAPGFVNYKKGALDSQVIKFTSCLPMVGGSLWVLRLLQPLKLVATT